MRIIAGKYKGRRIECPPGNAVRPTSDMVRGAIFNVLNNHIDWENLNVLDIFCGTGAIGMEALSRGAKFCTFIDNNTDSIKYTEKNLEKVPPESYEILRMNAEKLLRGTKKYHLVFIDPPYRTTLAQDVLDIIVKNNWLEQGGVIVVETGEKQELKISENCSLISERHYGNTKVFVLRYNDLLA